MPGLLPPLSMSILSPPPPFSCLSCFWKSLERLPSSVLMQLGGRHHHHVGVMGVRCLWNSNVVLQCKHTTTNICWWMTARWRISPMEIIHQIQWPPLTLCWSTDTTCCFQYRQRLVFMLAPAHNLNMSRCYFQKALQRVLATQVIHRSHLIHSRSERGENVGRKHTTAAEEMHAKLQHLHESWQRFIPTLKSRLELVSSPVFRPFHPPSILIVPH